MVSFWYSPVPLDWPHSGLETCPHWSVGTLEPCAVEFSLKHKQQIKIVVVQSIEIFVSQKKNPTKNWGATLVSSLDQYLSSKIHVLN